MDTECTVEPGRLVDGDGGREGCSCFYRALLTAAKNAGLMSDVARLLGISPDAAADDPDAIAGLRASVPGLLPGIFNLDAMKEMWINLRTEYNTCTETYKVLLSQLPHKLAEQYLTDPPSSSAGLLEDMSSCVSDLECYAGALEVQGILDLLKAKGVPVHLIVTDNCRDPKLAKGALKHHPGKITLVKTLIRVRGELCEHYMWVGPRKRTCCSEAMEAPRRRTRSTK